MDQRNIRKYPWENSNNMVVIVERGFGPTLPNHVEYTPAIRSILETESFLVTGFKYSLGLSRGLDYQVNPKIRFHVRYSDEKLALLERLMADLSSLIVTPIFAASAMPIDGRLSVWLMDITYNNTFGQDGECFSVNHARYYDDLLISNVEMYGRLKDVTVPQGGERNIIALEAGGFVTYCDKETLPELHERAETVLRAKMTQHESRFDSAG